ncbi:U-box domain-containing protein 5 [Dorcoceras hygrometricum]|uniref:RING-type E3 ubiquitin transferase n=1 Tax=Dorcoceras hygrometricum TaxID=472368 RepID=A0A2Z7BZ75_9LAMI|nr:U-box domain-containing protein 5 [Dorcoceras hygrometricum]KZV47606.1 U-box domain-containing protein 5 [Dorcoceras hygrometricum]
MGSDTEDILEGLPTIGNIKVHARMCLELFKVVIMVSKIFPEIEAARPRCTSGIEALCLLNNGIIKAKSLIQHCSESSALYLALTGEVIITRCKKSRNLLEQSLDQVQNMVPVVLAAKISGIISDLRSAAFCLDPPEMEAGKLLRDLLHKYGSAADPIEKVTVSVIQTVSSLLHLTSQKALLIEKRSIRKLVDKFGESEPTKRKILLFFLNLLNKYGKLIIMELNKSSSAVPEEPFLSTGPYDFAGEVDLHMSYRFDQPQIKMLSRPVPPEEFICPLTSRLMYDPVVIASGQTYERMWIQKWFDEGNDTCPKTKVKLVHLSLTSNSGMKDLILKWCDTHNVSIPDPKMQDLLVTSLETSANSIASLSNSMNDLNLPLDLRLPPISSHGSDSSNSPISIGAKTSHETDMKYFSKFSSLPWESQCNEIEGFKRMLEKNDASWSVVPPQKFIQLLLRFLQDAFNFGDVNAQMSGCLLLLEFVQKDRTNSLYLKEDVLVILASFLDTEAAKHALFVLEVLLSRQHCSDQLAASGALLGIINILDRQILELLEPALKILSILSWNDGLASIIRPLGFVSKLIPLLEDNALARYCVTILKNLCDIEEIRVSIAETEGCISAISELLDKDSQEDQECAVSILLSLCTQRVLYCQLVMNEGVIPGLVQVSVNGNNKAKAMALELLRILKDEFSSSRENMGSVAVKESTEHRKDKKTLPKSGGLFGKIFSKQVTFSSKKKRLNPVD